MTSRAEAALRAVADLDEPDAGNLLKASLDVWANSGAAMAGIELGPLGGRSEPRTAPNP
jgi:hypothetical protein